MQHEPERTVVSNANEPEIGPLRKSRWIVVFCSHDDYYGRFADGDGRTNWRIPKIFDEDYLQSGIPRRPIWLARSNRKAVQLFHLEQERQERDESLRSANDRFIAGSTDALIGEEADGWFAEAIPSSAQPIRDEIHRLRQGTVGRNRQRAWSHVGPGDTADFRAGIPRFQRSALRALEGNLIGA